MTLDYEKCIECGKCTRDCLFLEKYDINLKDYASLESLAYSCYLCGECKRTCPVNIDGCSVSLSLREKKINKGYNPYLKGYASLLLEKKNYLFKNYKNTDSKRVFFPGCNFPAYYPSASRAIMEKLKVDFGISTVFDCCGKPIADLGMVKEKEKIKNSLYKKFKRHGIEELILLCPNCYYYFRDNLDIKVSMIYEHCDIMESLILKEELNTLEGMIFLPCPDKDERLIYNMISKYIGNLKEIKNIQCCGAGGCALVKEKNLSDNMQESFKSYKENIYVYCGTCSGMISKTNKNTKHILCRLMGNEKKVSAGIKTVKNRIIFSFQKQR